MTDTTEETPEETAEASPDTLDTTAAIYRQLTGIPELAAEAAKPPFVPKKKPTRSKRG